MANLTESFPILQDRIKHLLLHDPKCMEYRDNDEKLVARIWADEMGGTNFTRNISMFQFLCKYVDGSIYSADSITRARRSIQKEYESCRGLKYNDRQHNKTKDAIKIISKF